MPLELPRSGLVEMVLQIGQHDHVGFALKFAYCRHGALDGGLPVHFRLEEQVEIAPLFLRRQRRAGAGRDQFLGERVAVQQELDPVRLAQPLAEMPHHVQQDLVAIGHHERPAHSASLSRAVAISAGARERLAL